MNKVKAKIVELVPGIRTYENRCMTCGYGFEFCKCLPQKTEWYQDRPITLADVLRAMRKGLGKYDSVELYISDDAVELIHETGTYDGEGDERSFVKYDLTADFDGQTDEVKAFLGRLLGVI